MVGEAKRKADDLKAFLSNLTAGEKTTSDLTQRLLNGLIKPKGMYGACYRVSVLLNRILAKEHGVASNVVLGWINDGDDIFISHAWLEIEGKKVDLMAERPMHGASNRGPTIARPGALRSRRLQLASVIFQSGKQTPRSCNAAAPPGKY